MTPFQTLRSRLSWILGVVTLYFFSDSAANLETSDSKQMLTPFANVFLFNKSNQYAVKVETKTNFTGENFIHPKFNCTMCITMYHDTFLRQSIRVKPVQFSEINSMQLQQNN